ncbi:dihydropteroate synthase [Marinobacter zhanjiangensis]|uniref:Dihydropteroate synthase n=1 Tax=Marinobacter zhanjiangensis TaxID=578215 RepID=A0ABQ3B5I8_9GAMM|nr:dihydropteroate synthase [Marinobacter zhanjiangensis]GGY80342.1 dihydropteroate synthase [Marinobacter zhanjiangensis]
MLMTFAGRELDMARSHVMGIVNVTPDSFSDGGRYNTVDMAVQRARQMVADGAAFVDVGGESTRPGAEPVAEQEELDRVCPVIEAIARSVDTVISVDTSTPSVMREAANLGAGLINDVRALERPGAVEAAMETGLPVCLMHMKGAPGTMQADPEYRHVVRDVATYLMDRVRHCEAAGVSADKVLLDPGFGFGKALEHNLQLLAALEQLQVLGYPLLVGMSRKTMLGHITGRDVGERLPASLAAATIAALKGVSVIRVHDVRETVDAVKVVEAMRAQG